MGQSRRGPDPKLWSPGSRRGVTTNHSVTYFICVLVAKDFRIFREFPFRSGFNVSSIKTVELEKHVFSFISMS